ncbi:MAG: hypothetical protein IT222_00585 [Crocinitomix sp.]|nr:hypothetical protein [Crocinitomix sp.]
MKTKILLPILYVVLVLVGCKKDPPIPETTEPVMPPLTHQGLNTFGCYINFPSAGASGEQGGELFVAGGANDNLDIPALSGQFDENEHYLGLQATRYLNNEIDENDNIRIRVSAIEGPGEYEIEMFGDNKLLAYRNWYGEKCDYYFDTLIQDMAKVTITYLNETENIIAGTFYMNLLNRNCAADTIMKITDGRFDFKY